jgi:hypothetical protein
MSTKKIIRIEYDEEIYSFAIDLSTRSVDFITRQFDETHNTLIGMNDVPDRVQIMLYRAISQLVNANPN